MEIKYALINIRSENIGDHIQLKAMYDIYKRMGIDDSEIVFFDVDNVERILEKDVTYVAACVMCDNTCLRFIEKVRSIKRCGQFRFIPVSIGYTRLYNLNEERLIELEKTMLDELILPIGCRDDDSAVMYKNVGYDSYVFGCITNTLPRRPDGEYDTAYIIDVPDELYEYIPEGIQKKAVTLTQTVSPSIPAQEQYDMAVRQFDRLRDTASLVITMRYHVAMPCAAMGIPVIMVEIYPGWVDAAKDVRFSELNPYIHIYTHDEWGHIDWKPEPVPDFEETKEMMIGLAVSRIRNEVQILETSSRLLDFFAPNRERFLGGIQKDVREKADLSCFFKDFFSGMPDDFQYYLYGLADRYLIHGDCPVLSYIQKKYPKAEFLGFVDGKKRGTFFGKKALSPDEMEIGENTYCFVSAYNANEFVKKLFEERGYDQSRLWLMPEDMVMFIYCIGLTCRKALPD